MFSEWLAEKECGTKFEKLSKEELAEMLRLFYPSANQVFSGNLVVQKAQGLDTSSSHCPISPDYLNQIFKN